MNPEKAVHHGDTAGIDLARGCMPIGLGMKPRISLKADLCAMSPCSPWFE
jgi:hypothetical protein